MQLTSLNDTLPQPQEQMEPEPEDAWLNDVGPLSRSQSEANNKETVPSELETPLETYTLLDYTELLAQQYAVPLTRPTPTPAPAPPQTRIGPGHRLWPVMLRLSERVWQELHHAGPTINQGPAREPALIGFVRSRSLDLLRADHTLACQVHDLVEAEQLLQGIIEEVLGYGPLEPLLKSEDISEITAVGPQHISVMRNGKLQEVADCFEDECHMSRIIENILRRAGRRIDPHWPMADVRLPDGLCVNVIMPPHAIHGPTITIRKTARQSLLSMGDLVQLGSMTQEMADFLVACVQCRLNMVICGSVGSGRTTLLNALASCIPTEQRIITIEDVAELQLSQRHVIALESRQADPFYERSCYKWRYLPPRQGTLSGGQVTSACGGPDAVGRVTMRDLVLQALRMRPERLLVGECRGSEVVELLQAMYSGCNGVLATVYAHNLRDCLTRLEVMYLAGGMHLPIATIRAQIVGALDVIVHVSCLRDGSHKVMNIAEVQGLEGDIIKLQSIFHYQDTEVDATTGKVQGIFRPGGFRPHCMAKFAAANIQLPREMFMPVIARQLNGKQDISPQTSPDDA